MAVEKQLMKKSANAKTDKMKQLLDNWRQELKQLEVDTKQKTRENFDKIKQNCDDKVSCQGIANVVSVWSFVNPSS